MANYSLGIKPIPDVPNGHTFTGDNFLQLNAHTPILEGKTGLTFINCNLTNCDPPADSVYVGCKPKHASFCTHVHEHFIDHGLAECAEDCAHVVSTDVIEIDGQVVDTIYHYEDTIA